MINSRVQYDENLEFPVDTDFRRIGILRDPEQTGGGLATSLTTSNLTFTNGYAGSEVKKYTGDIIYVENRRTVSRSIDLIEDVKLVVEF